MVTHGAPLGGPYGKSAKIGGPMVKGGKGEGDFGEGEGYLAAGRRPENFAEIQMRFLKKSVILTI